MERQKASALSQSRLLVATNDQLKKNLEEQSALLSMLSHEVKTPLTTLKLLVFRSSLRKEIGIQLRSIENVIDDVALMDRIKSDFDCVEQFDIEKLIQGQWQSLSDGMEHEKHLHVDIEGDTGIVGNQLAMQVIIKNLISNAIKYGVGPFVQIRFKREGDNARLQVENLCNGIQPEEVGKLTKKYYRASNVSGLRGTGLGLWICKTLSEANQYKISIAVKERLFLVTIRLVL
jgi:signal transduction histidine kinase